MRSTPDEEEGEAEDGYGETRQVSEEPERSDGEDQYQSPTPPAAELSLPLHSSTGSNQAQKVAPPAPLKRGVSSSAPAGAILGARDNNLKRSARPRVAR